MRMTERSPVAAGGSTFRRMTKVLAVAAFLVISVQIAIAQEPGEKPAASPTESVAISKPGTTQSTRNGADVNYRIGPGDLLDIRAFNLPKISREAVRVDNRGMISMPLIPDEIQAACRTENELALEIRTRYLEYFKNPQVDVFVKEYQSQPVAVIGAVKQPGRFLLQRQVRLLELLSFAGGPDLERAGRSIQLVHATSSSICQKPSSDAGEEAESVLVSYNLSDTLRGDDRSNPYAQPGDIITIPEAEQVYVVGNVLKPSAIPLKEPVSVSTAIAIAGGTLKDTKTDRVRIVRQMPGSGTKTEIFVDLKAIEKRRAEDIALQANDIVDVPSSVGAKSILRGILRTVAPSIGSLPVRVIP